MMKMQILGWLLFLLLQYLAAQVHAQDQSGFISLDCGLVPKDESYKERTTDLTYVSDADFITSGESKSIKDEYKLRFEQQAQFLRSFPRGVRNCYSFNLTKDGHYLIKASFVYGNYDDRNEGPEFDLYIGTNLWTTITIENATTAMRVEIMHVLTSDRLQVCLVKTGNSTPFISSLEVRPLRNGTYVAQRGSLMTFGRFYIGAADDPGFIRFPEDVRDRSWVTMFNNDWTRLTTNNTINNTIDYEVPLRALRGAATPRNHSLPLKLSFPLPSGLRIYAYLHFLEPEELKANESRVFNVTYNGRSWAEWDYYSPDRSSPGTFYSSAALDSSDGKYEFILQKKENSTHPPIINAVEIHMAIDLIQPETNQSDVNAITHVRSTYGLVRDSWQGDPCVPLNYSWVGLNCSYNDLDPPRIIGLNLSASGLTGEIAQAISGLTQLTNLDLSRNNLAGGLPKFLGQMTSLRVLNLSENQLTGSVPADLIERASSGSLTLSLEGNPNLCVSNSCNDNNSGEKKKQNVVVPIVATILSVSIVLAVLSIILIHKRKKPQSTKGGLHMPTKLEQKDRRFSYSAVLKMTSNFERILGKGGFGAVYQGYLDDGEQVAVKVLDESSAQGYKQFKAEVELLLRVHHKYLVSLVGYCDEGDKLALIYELMANRDLKEHLSGRHGARTLTWEARLRIASEAAQGLEYLHHGCRPPIVHRDVKTTNILLNEDFQAKLADFGLSRSFPAGSETHVSTFVVGTPGFLDPEYCRSNRLTEKSDVYSFGVALLEIITNRPVIDQTREKPHISDWVNFMLRKGDIGNIVDPKLQGDFGTNSAWKIVEVALACVSPSSRTRPTMTHVVMELNECLAFETARKHGGHEMNSEVSMVRVGEESSCLTTELMPQAR